MTFMDTEPPGGNMSDWVIAGSSSPVSWHAGRRGAKRSHSPAEERYAEHSSEELQPARVNQHRPSEAPFRDGGQSSLTQDVESPSSPCGRVSFRFTRGLAWQALRNAVQSLQFLSLRRDPCLADRRF